MTATGMDAFPTPEVAPFHALALSRLAHEMKAAGRSVIHMEFGQPSTGAPGAAVAEAQRVLARDGMGYWGERTAARGDRAALS